MSIAIMRDNSIYPKILKDLPSRVSLIKKELQKLSGKIILTIEETTGAHWLYVELKDFVEKIVICNPLRNSLLKEGPKNDAKDAAELCRLLRAGLLKEVYHSDNENYKIRKIVSSYDDLIKASVRVMNQYISFTLISRVCFCVVEEYDLLLMAIYFAIILLSPYSTHPVNMAAIAESLPFILMNMLDYLLPRVLLKSLLFHWSHTAFRVQTFYSFS